MDIALPDDQERIPWVKIFRSREIRASGKSTIPAWVTAGAILRDYAFTDQMTMLEIAEKGQLRCQHHMPMATCSTCVAALENIRWAVEPSPSSS